MVYLDNSATTYPKPDSVRAAVARAVSLYAANPGRSGYPMATATASAVYEVRKKAADFFGAEPENVIFTKNCTEALNQVIFGKLKKGDHVIVSDLEHNAVIRPVKALEAAGVECTVFTTFVSDKDKTVDALRQSIRENTKLVVCTAASNVFGIRLPIGRLAALCNFYGIEFCVDAAQSAGVIPMNMAAEGIDYLCVPSHKGLYGVMGAGMLITAKGSSLVPRICGGTGTASASPEQPENAPERFESGTLNVPGIIGMGAGIEFVKAQNPRRIHEKEMRTTCYMYEALSRLRGVRLYTPYPVAEHFVGVLSFNFEDIPSEELGAYLAERGIAVRAGLHCAPSAHKKFGTENGTVRIAPSIFTQKSSVDSFLRQLRAYRPQ